MRYAPLIVLVIAGFNQVSGAPGEPRQHGIGLVVRVERGGVVSRVTVSMTNTTDRAFTFRTGARGGAGSLDDGFRIPGPAADDAREPRGPRDPRPRARRLITGTAPRVVPDVQFDHGEAGTITLRPPSFSGPTRRAMEPETATVPPGGELLYASFAVPTIHLGHELAGATMRLEDGTELSTRRLAYPTGRGAG